MGTIGESVVMTEVMVPEWVAIATIGTVAGDSDRARGMITTLNPMVARISDLVTGILEVAEGTTVAVTIGHIAEGVRMAIEDTGHVTEIGADPEGHHMIERIDALGHSDVLPRMTGLRGRGMSAIRRKTGDSNCLRTRRSSFSEAWIAKRMERTTSL